MVYRPSRFSFLPIVVKNLLIINGLLFFATVVFQQMGIDLIHELGLFFPYSEYFRPYQLVTHMFMHGNFNHLLFNMLALWMFGSPMENYWGPQRFLTYYFATGLGAALLHMGVNAFQYHALTEAGALSGGFSANALGQLLYSPVVGASGAIFGLLLAYGMTFPNQEIYVYFLLPIKAKYFVIIYGVLELVLGITKSNSAVAHFAHLGGMLFGFLLIRYWRKNAFRF